MLYLHIPFCKSRCSYCDFFSSVQRRADVAEAYVRRLCLEIRQRRGEAHGVCHTLYLGGGTPSLLPVPLLAQIFDAVRSCFPLAADAEVTVEANPDDVSPEWIRAVRELGANRISLGIQTFRDETLRFLGRRHTAEEARRAVRLIAEAGIANVSADLIMALPHPGITDAAEHERLWLRDLDDALALPIQHLSAYSLQVAAGTRMAKLMHSGAASEIADEVQARMYRLLQERTAAAGFEQYEISNFARPGRRSRHNTLYWTASPYIGLGAGAHSFNGSDARRANLCDLMAYIRSSDGDVPHTVEYLSAAERQNDRVFTALRTADGLPLAAFAREFGADALRALLRAAQPHLRARRLVLEGFGVDLEGIELDLEGIELRLKGDGLGLKGRSLGNLRIPPEFYFVSDDIVSDLMSVD